MNNPSFSRSPPLHPRPNASGVVVGPDGQPMRLDSCHVVTDSSGAATGFLAAPQPRLSLRETAVDACSRKEHAVNRGYYRDPFLKLMTDDKTYFNSPLMNRGYWLRVKAVEAAVNRFLEMHPEDAVQIISIGAGLDTLFFRWAAAACSKHGSDVGTAAGADLVLPTCPSVGDFARVHRFVEVDHADLIKAKRDIVLAHAGMRDLAHLKSDQEQPATEKEAHEHSNCIYRLMTADLTKPEELVAALLDPRQAQKSCVLPNEHDSGHSCIDNTMPTLIVAECVLVYMTANESTACLESLLNGVFGQSAKSRATPVLFLSYDAVGPDDRFGQVMVESLAELGIPLKGIAELKTPADHERRARAVGFNAVRAQTMKQLYDTVHIEDKKRLDAIERIDDWDEWALMHNHYSLTFAGRLSEENAAKRGGAMPNLFLGTTVAGDAYAQGPVAGDGNSPVGGSVAAERKQQQEEDASHQ